MRDINMSFARRALLSRAAMTAAGSTAPNFTWAQDKYPSRNIRIVVPFPAGATTDMLARLFAQRLSETMGRPSSSRMSAVAAARSAPIRSPRPRPTATRCCSTTSRSSPRRRHCNMPGARGTTSSRISSRSRSAPMCRSCCWRILPCRRRTSRNSSNMRRTPRSRCSTARPVRAA